MLKAPLSAAIIAVAAVACADANDIFSPHVQKNGIMDPNHQGISPPRIITKPDDVVVEFTAGVVFCTLAQDRRRNPHDDGRDGRA